MSLRQSLLLALWLMGCTNALPTDPEVTDADVTDTDVADTKTSEHSKRALPFTKMIVFGDDFSDNAQGSYAHGLTQGSLNWGNGTWTDGQVAVSYLAQQLNIPLTYDYAIGAANGGSKVGSVCNSSAVPTSQLGSYAHLPNGAIAPDALSQISNYSSSPAMKANIGNTLHVLWTGNNDVLPSLGWVGRFTLCSDGLCAPGQAKFLAGMSNCFQQTLNNLLATGAKYILVPNIYPRHLTPWQSMWISSDPKYIANFGSVIDKANANLQSIISSTQAAHPNVRIMYFDANSWMQSALKDPNLSGVGPGQGGKGAGTGYTYTCVDGCTVQAPSGITNWNLYWQNKVLAHKADDFFWMTETVTSTTVMKSLASDMMQFLSAQNF